MQEFSKEMDGNCFVEDAGFFVDHLNNFPGAFSSHVQEMIGNEGILKLMDGVTNRVASFRAVITLRLEGDIHVFHGSVQGQVAQEIMGTQGFGYDPIFIPEGYKKTFAEMTQEQKNSMSHRSKALEEMCNFLLAKIKNS